MPDSGQTISHYRIIEKLGQGGMGVVFLAHDTSLDRKVALKFLPDIFSGDLERLPRFEREAKALAKLAHPNILTIFDFGREGDTTYAVTELLEGKTLREQLVEGALPWRKAVEIAAAMAEGLASAHNLGIVHRDVKPSNVFLTTDGRTKILDFGLARHVAAPLQEAETCTSLEADTTPGTVLGTVGYMSPEQVRGQTADHRSDIFSLGCVLYEMLSGRRAFERPSAGVFVQDFIPGKDTTASRRKLAGFEADYITESFAISPDGTHIVLSLLQLESSIMIAEGVAGLVPARDGK